jgi:hypothetical protein
MNTIKYARSSRYLRNLRLTALTIIKYHRNIIIIIIIMHEHSERTPEHLIPKLLYQNRTIEVESTSTDK